MRVLVVEDHVVLANRIGEGLRDAGFAVDVVHDGAAALQSTMTTDYDGDPGNRGYLQADVAELGHVAEEAHHEVVGGLVVERVRRTDLYPAERWPLPRRAKAHPCRR